jgi:hypothetical protein
VELEHPHATLRPVGIFEQLDGCDLCKRAGALGDGGSRPAAPEQFDHWCASHAFLRRIALLALQP